MKKKIIILLFLFLSVILLSSCSDREAEKVSYNISKEADNFNIARRVTVFNTRTDKVLLEIIGNLSVQKSSGDIDIIVEVDEGVYKKHFVSLNSWTTYVVEDITGAFVDKYHYEVNLLPQMIIPFTITMKD